MKTKRHFAVLVALAIGWSWTVQAQVIRTEQDTGMPARWSRSIGAQLAQSLNAPDDGIKAIALQQAVYFARYGDGLDLSPAIVVLHSICANAPDEASRMAAVAALSAIGDGAELWRLKATVKAEASPRVRIAVLAALYERYGAEIFAQDDATARSARVLLSHYKEAGNIAVPPVLAID